MRSACNQHCRSTAVSLAVVVMLAACGGSNDAAAPTLLKGVAASGAALAGASVMVIDSDTSTTNPLPVTTLADGSYTVDVTGLKTPLVVLVTATVEGVETKTLAVVPSVTANADNIANVTPLTNAVAALIAPGGDPLALLVPATLESSATPIKVSNATALVVNTLAAELTTAKVTVATFNPLTTPFTANGSGVDGVLDKLKVEVASSGVSITNLTAPVSGSGAQPVLLTAAQTDTPTVVPTLPASTAAGDLPSEADIAALGAKFQACLALPVASRVTVNSAGTVTAVSATCNYAPADWKSAGRTWAQQVGQFLFTKNQVTGAKVGKGLIAVTLPGDNLIEPREFKHPYCNTATCVVVRWPVTSASNQTFGSDWQIGKVDGVWNFVGNQSPYRAFTEPRLNRKINANRDGAAAGNTGDPYFFKDRFESVLRVIFDLNSPNTNGIRAVQVKGPGLPADGLVLFRSQRCGTDDLMGITYQNGSTRLNTNTAAFQFWTGGSSAHYILDAANLDGTALAMPVPVLNTTTASFQDFSPTPVANQAATIPAWSRYKFEIYRYAPLSDTPDEIFYARITAAAENATQGPGKPWPTLAASFVDAYLKPTGASAGALTTTAHTMSWAAAAAAGTYVGSSYLFSQNFATLANSQAETATYGLRTRLDFEPAALGDTNAVGFEFASVVAGTSLSTFTENRGTNPNPRCTSTNVVPLTTNTSDYREAGLSFRGIDRKLNNAIWFWDN